MDPILFQSDAILLGYCLGRSSPDIVWWEETPEMVREGRYSTFFQVMLGEFRDSYSGYEFMETRREEVDLDLDEGIYSSPGIESGMLSGIQFLEIENPGDFEIVPLYLENEDSLGTGLTHSVSPHIFGKRCTWISDSYPGKVFVTYYSYRRHVEELKAERKKYSGTGEFMELLGPLYTESYTLPTETRGGTLTDVLFQLGEICFLPTVHRVLFNYHHEGIEWTRIVEAYSWLWKRTTGYDMTINEWNNEYDVISGHFDAFRNRFPEMSCRHSSELDDRQEVEKRLRTFCGNSQVEDYYDLGQLLGRAFREIEEFPRGVYYLRHLVKMLPLDDDMSESEALDLLSDSSMAFDEPSSDLTKEDDERQQRFFARCQDQKIEFQCENVINQILDSPAVRSMVYARNRLEQKVEGLAGLDYWYEMNQLEISLSGKWPWSDDEGDFIPSSLNESSSDVTRALDAVGTALHLVMGGLIARSEHDEADVSSEELARQIVAEAGNLTNETIVEHTDRALRLIKNNDYTPESVIKDLGPLLEQMVRSKWPGMLKAKKWSTGSVFHELMQQSDPKNVSDKKSVDLFTKNAMISRFSTLGLALYSKWRNRVIHKDLDQELDISGVEGTAFIYNIKALGDLWSRIPGEKKSP